MEAAWKQSASITQPFGPSWVARVKVEEKPSHAQVPFSSSLTLIAVKLRPTHAQPYWLSGTVLESPQLEGSVEKVSLNHAAIWAGLGGPGYGGRDTFACPSPYLLNRTSDHNLIATDARTIKLALCNRP